jgi:hypothetical protein
MRVKRLYSACTIMIFLCLQSANAALAPALDLDQLTADASLIAVGQIVLVQEVGKTTVQFGDRMVSARVMVAELRVDQELKGTTKDSSSTLRFHFIVPDEFTGWRSVAPLSYRVFFLTESSGEFRLADPYHPSVAAIPATQAQEGTAIERVIDQLGAVLGSASTPTEERRGAIFALNDSKNPSAIRVLKRFADIDDVTLRLSVAAALLGHNDLYTLKFAVDTLLNPNPAFPPDLLHNLSYGILIGVKDDRAVSELTRLLRAGSAEARRAAASALMRTGSSLSIDALLSAISDSDRDVRYYSVVALAEITGQTDWRPNIEDFMADQDKYVKHWREWSQSR